MQGWEPIKEVDLEITGVFLGSGIGNLEELHDTAIAYHDGGYKKIHPLLFPPRLLSNLVAGMVSMRYGFNHCATTACTTGAHSLGDAMRFISTSLQM